MSLESAALDTLVYTLIEKMLDALKPIGQLPGVADYPWQWLLLLYITFLSSSDIYSPDIY